MTNTAPTNFADHAALVARHQRVCEGLRHFERPEFTAIADHLATIGDFTVAAAYIVISRAVREIEQAASAIGRAPRYCGVCRDLAALRAATLDVLASEPDSALVEADIKR